jgi:hypothetical protein
VLYGFVCLRLLSCVPNVASFSGLSVLDCPSNPIHDKVYPITIMGSSLPVTNGKSVFPSTPVSFINKTDRHEIAEILLKVALNTITLTQ